MRLLYLKYAFFDVNRRIYGFDNMIESLRILILTVYTQETLNLKLENVLYKKAYLLREIKVLKELVTPQLTEIEEEIGLKLAATEYNAPTASVDIVTEATDADLAMAMDVVDDGDMFSAHIRAILSTEDTDSDSNSNRNLTHLEKTKLRAERILAAEAKAREEMVGKLEELNKKKQELEEVLDKKRKFLEDIPVKITKIRTALAEDLQKPLEMYRKEILGVEGNEEEEGDDDGEQQQEEQENDGNDREGGPEGQVAEGAAADGEQQSTGVGDTREGQHSGKIIEVGALGSAESAQSVAGEKGESGV
jgi:hypothetical protein